MSFWVSLEALITSPKIQIFNDIPYRLKGYNNYIMDELSYTEVSHLLFPPGYKLGNHRVAIGNTSSLTCENQFATFVNAQGIAGHVCYSIAPQLCARCQVPHPYFFFLTCYHNFREPTENKTGEILHTRHTTKVHYLTLKIAFLKVLLWVYRYSSTFINIFGFFWDQDCCQVLNWLWKSNVVDLTPVTSLYQLSLQFSKIESVDLRVLCSNKELQEIKNKMIWMQWIIRKACWLMRC